ncbi:hypothetical protein FRB90_006430 [Tulasnella sp. 427]|nr:hypothetical protein FRB90_006430 [Tulasnella sp. 427]
MVSSTWMEPALDGLWRALPSLFPLLELLGPLEYDEALGWTFQNGVERPDWNRWLFYASRIHDLIIDDTQPRGSGNSVINPEALIHLRTGYSKWGGVALVPNIQKLSVSYNNAATISTTLLFIDTPLKTLDLILKTSAPSAFAATRRVMASMTSMSTDLKLESFSFQCWEDRGHALEFDNSLATFICSQPSISSMLLVLGINTPMIGQVVQAISALKAFALVFPLDPTSDEIETVFSLLLDHRPSVEDLAFNSGWVGGVAARSPIPMPQSLLEFRRPNSLRLPWIDLTQLDQAMIAAFGGALRQMDS